MGRQPRTDLALQYGVMMPAWVPSEGYGRGGFDAHERDLTGGAFPMFLTCPMFSFYDDGIPGRAPRRS